MSVASRVMSWSSQAALFVAHHRLVDDAGIVTVLLDGRLESALEMVLFWRRRFWVIQQLSSASFLTV